MKRLVIPVGPWQVKAWMPVLAAYLIIGSYYVQSPLFSKPDEANHTGYVIYLKHNGRMPVMRIRDTRGDWTIWEPEAHQPPLYYSLIALLTLTVPVVDEDLMYPPNPHFLSTAEGNINPLAPTPWTQVKIVYVGRWVSFAFGALLGLITYAIARELADARVSAAAMAFTVLNPQFLFISSSLSNDIPAATAATASVWLLVRMLRDGITLRRGLAFGAIVGVGVLLKLSVLVTVGLLPLVALWAVRAGYRLYTLIPGLLASLVLAFIIPLPWFLYNMRTYGDPFGVTAMFFYMGRRSTPFSPNDWFDLLSFLWRGYWLDFSVGGLVFTHWLIYALPAIVLLGGLVGAVRFMRRSPASRWVVAALIIYPILVFIALLPLTTQTAGFMGGGRLLFPATAAIAIVMAVGWSMIVPKPVLMGMAGLAAVAAVLAASLYLWPATSLPIPVQVASSETPHIQFTFEDRARITNYSMETTHVRPGTIVHVQLWWQCLQPFSENDSVFVQLWDVSDPQNPRYMSGVDTYPGLGLRPTLAWVPGQAFIDP